MLNVEYGQRQFSKLMYSLCFGYVVMCCLSQDSPKSNPHPNPCQSRPTHPNPPLPEPGPHGAVRSYDHIGEGRAEMAGDLSLVRLD